MESIFEHAISRLGGSNTPQECYEQIGEDSDIFIRVQYVDNPKVGIDYYREGESVIEIFFKTPT